MKLKVKPYRDLSVRSKLASVLMLFALVAAANFLSVDYFRELSKIDAAVVDAAGRQRMLSQKIAYLSSSILRGKEEVRDELGKTIDLYHTSLMALKYGGIAPGVAKDASLPATPSNILPTLMSVESSWNEFKVHAQVIQEQPVYQEEKISSFQVNSNNEKVEEVKVSKIINPALLTSMEWIEKRTAELLSKNDALVKEYVRYNEEKQQKLNTLLWVLLLISGLIIALSLWVVEKFIIKPVSLIQQGTKALVQGELSSKIKSKSHDEIGSAITDLNILTENLQQAARFADHVGQGQFDISFQVASDQDVLGKALLDMRAQLQRVEKEEAKRKWASDGIALFADILRQQNEDLGQLAARVMSTLIKYLNANQGALFIVNQDGEEHTLELLAMHAWGKKKYLQKAIKPGEDLLGQAWLEGEMVYMTDVPDGYVEITSGIGKANPRSILMVPLKLNEDVFGMLEIASFKEYEEHELKFVEKVSENIASTFSTANVNYKTRLLLEQSQQQTEELRAQEEEMRQNMEELSATQEEMGRQEKEYLEMINQLEAKLRMPQQLN